MLFEENDYRIQQAEAWEAVWDTLAEVTPTFSSEPGTGLENAVQAIRELSEKAKAYDRIKAVVANT